MSLVAETATADERRVSATDESPYFNRELSWLEFNWRVLEEAMDERHPLLERVKFLSIFCTNLDEFFMIRVSGIREQIHANVTMLSLDGKTPSEQLAGIRQRVCSLLETKRHYWHGQLMPLLAENGIQLLDYEQLTDEQRQSCAEYFEREVFPVLTPLAVDPGHPFPHISNMSLNLAVVINDPEHGERFARIKVPAVLPRLLPLPPGPCASDALSRVPPERRTAFVWIEQVIAAHVGRLFPGLQVAESHPFRVVRDADMEIQEDEAADLLRTIEQSVRQRRFGAVVSLIIHRDMPARVRELLLDNMKLTPTDLYEVEGALGLSDLMLLTRLDRPDLKDPPFVPTAPPLLRNIHNSAELFAAIRSQDILLHHPYDSFQPLVALIEAAAEDPDVLAIKQTLYRVGSNSPIVEALMNAREQDKQVTVLVELKARFDEENNITWARALESAGVHVVYGLVGLKTHAKLALVVRREQDGLRRYVHLGTGNYNATTARTYTDLGVLTARPDIGADVSDVFNALTGYSRQRQYRKLLVAPATLRSGFEHLIEREIGHARTGRPAHLIFKLNALIDKRMIDLLYQASQAGVEIDLVVRGMCCLRPGVPGMSENIRVRSIVGRFLEHSRIYSFENGGQPEVFIGSADLMSRNLDRRVETVFPVEDQQIVAQIRAMLQVYLRDTMRARVLMPDGSYCYARPAPGERPLYSQAFFAGDRDF
jgi:polyphosphate kinase